MYIPFTTRSWRSCVHVSLYLLLCVTVFNGMGLFLLFYFAKFYSFLYWGWISCLGITIYSNLNEVNLGIFANCVYCGEKGFFSVRLQKVTSLSNFLLKYTIYKYNIWSKFLSVVILCVYNVWISINEGNVQSFCTDGHFPFVERQFIFGKEGNILLIKCYWMWFIE